MVEFIALVNMVPQCFFYHSGLARIGLPWCIRSHVNYLNASDCRVQFQFIYSGCPHGKPTHSSFECHLEVHRGVLRDDRVTLAGALIRGQELQWDLIDCEPLVSELIWIDQVHVQVGYVQHLVKH